jgi:ParB/RepB/Spo0J family partition protein
MSTLRDVRVALIDDGRNVRKPLRNPARSKADQTLAKSIKRHGVLQPITVRAKGNRYVVVMGFRRLAAARHLGLETIPAVVETAPLEETILRQVAENVERKAMNPVEVAKALARYLEEHPDVTKHELGVMLGKEGQYASVWVSNKLAMLNLEPALRQKVEAGSLSESQAIQARKTLGYGRGRPRVIPKETEHEPSRSIEVPIGRFARSQMQGTVDIALQRASGHVEVTVHRGDRGLFLTLTPEEAKLLGRRLQQAGEALLAVAS